MSSPDLPPPRTYTDVPLVPVVDPEDLKGVGNVKPPRAQDSHKDACSPGADVAAVVRRRYMMGTLVTFKLLAPWTHEGILDDAVIRLAATFPLHEQQSPGLTSGTILCRCCASSIRRCAALVRK